MEINAGNILIILVGIVLCFFGIYLKRVTQIIMGFAWGAVIAFLLISGLAVGGMLDDSNEAIAILIVLAVGILMAVLAVKLERLLVMVQGVLLSFLICMVILGALLGNDGAAIAIILSLIISAVMGYLLWMYYRYAFICETAVVGSIMINHVWLIHVSGRTQCIFCTSYNRRCRCRNQSPVNVAQKNGRRNNRKPH